MTVSGDSSAVSFNNLGLWLVESGICVVQVNVRYMQYLAMIKSISIAYIYCGVYYLTFVHNIAIFVSQRRIWLTFGTDQYNGEKKTREESVRLNKK